MSQTTSAPRRKPVRKAAPTLVSTRRKIEIVGLMLMALALLVTLAFVTYTPADTDIARGIVEGQPRNAIGLVGARLAYALVERGIGYMALLFGGLLFAWGYALFRHREKVLLALTSACVALSAFLLAALLAWFRPAEGVPSRWAGAWGDGLARWLTDVLGSTGAFIALVLLLVVVVLVFVERDIQGAIDRVEELFRDFSAWIAGFGGQVAARRAERQDALAALPEPVTRTRRTKAPPALNAPSVPEPSSAGSAPPWLSPDLSGTPPLAAPFPDPLASRALGGTARAPYPPVPYDDAPFEDDVFEDDGGPPLLPALPAPLVRLAPPAARRRPRGGRGRRGAPCAAHARGGPRGPPRPARHRGRDGALPPPVVRPARPR